MKISMLVNIHIVFTGNFVFAFLHSPSTSLRILIALAISPFYFSYIAYSIHIGNFFWLTCSYFNIRQRYFIRKLQHCILKTQNNKNHKRLWKIYEKIFLKSLNLTKEIRIYNHFWSSLLSILFFIFILGMFLLHFIKIFT